jgi:integrase
MKGTITRYRKEDGRISWGYWFRHPATKNQITKSGFDTRSGAMDALNAALEKASGISRSQPTPPAGGISTAESAPKGDARMLSEYLDYWRREHAAPRCERKTLERYGDFVKYLERQLGSLRLCDLKASHVQEAVNRLYACGGAVTKEHPEGRPLAAKTVRSIATMLYTALGDAVRLELIATNPMADKRVRLPKRVKTEPAVLDQAMLAKLYETTREKRIYAFIVTSSSSGCRRGELLALIWPDVDFEKGLLAVTKSLEQTKEGLRVKGTKSGRPRYFPIDDFALEVLEEHRIQQDQDKLNFGSEYEDNGLVFCQPNGRFYSPDRVGARVKEALVTAGVPEFSLHSLRHSHATILLSAGVPLPVVSQRLGHADPNITLGVYSHALPSDVRAAAKLWRSALADVISEERKNKKSKMLGIARKKAVND